MQKSIGIQYFRSFACIAVFLSHLIGAMPETMLQFGNVNLNDTPLRIFWGGVFRRYHFLCNQRLFPGGK